jgi:hypothetical protein
MAGRAVAAVFDPLAKVLQMFLRTTLAKAVAVGLGAVLGTSDLVFEQAIVWDIGDERCCDNFAAAGGKEAIARLASALQRHLFCQ